MNAQIEIADVIMHTKTAEKDDIVTLPVTRYLNVLNAPNLITNVEEKPGAPFHLYVNETEEMDDNDIVALCGPII